MSRNVSNVQISARCFLILEKSSVCAEEIYSEIFLKPVAIYIAITTGAAFSWRHVQVMLRWLPVVGFNPPLLPFTGGIDQECD